MALSTIGTGGIADDAITSAKVDSTTTAFTVADLVVTNGITAGTSINAGTELVGNVSGRILLDASASATDVGDEFLLNATDASASNDGSKILFEEGTDDPNTVLNSNSTGVGGTINFLNTTTNTGVTTFNSAPVFAVGGGSGFTFVTRTDLTSAAGTISFDRSIINDKFTNYKLVFNSVRPATDGQVMALQVSVDNGVNFLVNTQGQKTYFRLNDGSTGSEDDDTSYTYELATNIGNDAGRGINGMVDLYSVSVGTDALYIIGEVVGQEAGDSYKWHGSSLTTVSTRGSLNVNFIKIYAASGDIAAGSSISVYGFN